MFLLAVAGPAAVLEGASDAPKTPAAIDAAEASAWGEPNEGISVRLVPEKRFWDDRETGRAGYDFDVIFKASIRDRGTKPVLVAQAQQTGELEADGVWHKWMEPVDVKSSVLGPNQELDNIAVVPDNKWRNAAAALAANPGKHTFRFAVMAQPADSNDGRAIRAVSNPIEIEYQSRAKQAGAAAEEYASVYFSGRVFDDDTGERMTNFLLQIGVLDPRKSDEVIWSDQPLLEPNFIGGQWSRTPELGGFWGAQGVIGGKQKAWARLLASGYLYATVTPEPVNGPADLQNLIVRMKRGAELTGRVLHQSGQPAAGAKVFLIDVPKLAVRQGETGWWFAASGPQFQNGAATTDASGRFKLTGDLKAAKEVVVVSADSRMVWAVTNSGPAAGRIITLPEPATIIVRYDIAGDDAEAGIGFQALCDEMNDDFRHAIKMDVFVARVANHTQIVLTNLAPGAYDIGRSRRLSLGGQTNATATNTSRGSYGGRSVGCDQRTIIVGAGEVKQVDLVRDTGFAINGQVAGLEPTRAVGAYIYVRPAGDTNDTREPIPGVTRVCFDALTCGTEGAFQTQRLKPGTYSIVAEADGPATSPPATATTPGIRRDPGYTGAAQVTIPIDGPPAPIKVELHRRVIVTPESELFASGRFPTNPPSVLLPAGQSAIHAPENAAAPSGNPNSAASVLSPVSDPDNPLNLSDDTIIKLFKTGKAMAVLASLSKMDFAWNKQTPNSARALEGVIRGAQGSGGDPFGSEDLRVGVLDGTVRIFSVGPDGKWDGARLARSDDPQLLGDLGAESDLSLDLPHPINWLNDAPLAQYLAGARTAHVLAKHGPHSAPPPPPDGKVNYGALVDGLRAAVELETTNSEVAAGETIGVRFHIRNSADYDIQVRSPFWRQGDELFVEDETGRRMKVKNVSPNRDLVVERKMLKPGEELEVGSRGLVFTLADGDDTQTNYPSDYSAMVAPGKYTLHFKLQFGDAVTAAWIPYLTPGQPTPLENLPEPLDWQGTLETGPVPVKVIPRTMPGIGSRPDTLTDPGNPLRLPPSLMTKLFQTGSAMRAVANASQQFFYRNQRPPAALEDLNAPLVATQANSRPLLQKGQGADPFGDGDLRIEASGHKLRIYSVGPARQWSDGRLARADDPKLEGELCLEADLLDAESAGFGPRLTSPNGDLPGFYFDGRRAHYLARERTKPETTPAPPGASRSVPAVKSTNAAVLNYGPPAGGLRAAIEFVLTNGGAANGEPLQVRVHVRNEGDQEAQISSLWNWPKQEDGLEVIEVKDEAGRDAEWKPGRLDEPNSPNDVRRQTIKPGGDAVVKSGWVVPEVTKEIWELAMNTENLVWPAGPAKYVMTAAFRFPDEPNGAPNLSGDWQGELKTGPASVSVERELALEISLGIRDNTRLGQFSTLALVEYPLAFRVKNTGKRTIGAYDTPRLFSNGIAHLLSKGGGEERKTVATFWNGMVQDLLPGKTFEHGLYADPIGFFGNPKDGDYQVWWTLGAHKSNSLHFLIKDGKAELEPNDPNAPPLPAPEAPDPGTHGVLR